MSDENKTAPKVPVFVISTESGISVPIFEHVITKGTGAGGSYLGPDFSTYSLEDAIKVHGSDNIRDQFISKLRQLSNGITKAARKIAGEDSAMLKDKFTKWFLELSAAGETKGALQARLLELYEELGNLDPSSFTDAGVFMAKFSELKAKIARINAELDAKANDKDDSGDGDAAQGQAQAA